MATQQVKPKKIYIPVDGIQRHEEFECWYEDGSLFCTVTGDFKAETDKVHLLGRTGGEIARIKPDHKALTMDVRVDKWTYRLRTYVIFKHYFFEGMLWQMFGSISNGRANFRNEDTSKNDVHIVRLRDFKGHGPCYEVRVKEIHKLRPAAAATVAMMVKEYYKGLSEGEGDEKMNPVKKLWRLINDTGYTYEQLVARGDIVPREYADMANENAQRLQTTKQAGDDED